MPKPELGTCYYPEHWPETQWEKDAARMADLGLTTVRIGEFAWSRLEPNPGQYDFDWLDRAIKILGAAGLKVVMSTPTATPPKWLVNQMPDMLPVDRNGHTRNFGSRRHYCFSHPGYRKACAEIAQKLAKHFGTHPAIIAWQTDNEYGCHDSTHSYSPAARTVFRQWLEVRYQTIAALNTAWGNVFWSMEYRGFDEIDLPNLSVTEANPAHWMDFHRFSSDQVKSFNKLQADIIRTHAPGRAIIHNFMGRILDFDHFALGEDLDIAAWDSYPLGFLDDRSDRPEAFKQKFARMGDPDFQAFHHDLYRAAAKGRWWVMEQQPGPVNWAPHNPAPAPGMVRLWTLEAFAHGAETVAYFRWRQAPFGQEQMHSGLLNPDNSTAPAFAEVKATAADIKALPQLQQTRADIAIVFDYPSAWAMGIQPQGAECDYFRLVFDFYKSLRGLGQSIDIVPANSAQLAGYKLLVIPGLFAWPDELVAALKTFSGQIIIGPRSGAKTMDFAIPEKLPPNLPAELLDLKITQIETLRADSPIATGIGHFQFWREYATPGPGVTTDLRSMDGIPAILSQNNITYLTGWPDERLMTKVMVDALEKADLTPRPLPEGVRIRQAGNLLFVFNYGPEPVDLTRLNIKGHYLLGSPLLAASGTACLKPD